MSVWTSSKAAPLHRHRRPRTRVASPPPRRRSGELRFLRPRGPSRRIRHPVRLPHLAHDALPYTLVDTSSRSGRSARPGHPLGGDDKPLLTPSRMLEAVLNAGALISRSTCRRASPLVERRPPPPIDPCVALLTCSRAREEGRRAERWAASIPHQRTNSCSSPTRRVRSPAHVLLDHL